MCSECGRAICKEKLRMDMLLQHGPLVPRPTTLEARHGGTIRHVGCVREKRGVGSGVAGFPKLNPGSYTTFAERRNVGSR